MLHATGFLTTKSEYLVAADMQVGVYPGVHGTGRSSTCTRPQSPAPLTCACGRGAQDFVQANRDKLCGLKGYRGKMDKQQLLRFLEKAAPLAAQVRPRERSITMVEDEGG
jgi:hypothetical protein